MTALLWRDLRSARHGLRRGGHIVAVVSVVVAGGAAGAQQGAGGPGGSGSADAVVFVASPRRPADAPPDGPPDVAAAREALPPATLDIVIVRTGRGRATDTRRQVFTRDLTRAHLRVDDDEWVFERNPVDGRRVTASFIDHRRRTIVFHDESDVRNRLGIRGWADVLAMGDPSETQTPAGTVRVRIAARRVVDSALLARPATRFPSYTQVDLAEWLEGR